MRFCTGSFRLALIAAIGAAAAGCSNSAGSSAGPVSTPSHPRTATASAARSPAPGRARSASASPGAAARPGGPASPDGTAGSGAGGTGGTVALSYRRYANPRFGFSTLRPASFRVQPPPADGDGQGWNTPDGRVTLAAYGVNNIAGLSPGQDEAAVARSMNVTYRAITGNVVTVSGYADGGGTIIYQRDVVGPGAIDTLFWKYPASQKARWDAAVTVTARAFRPGGLSTGH